MKIILGIFCVLMALFAGGCALILFSGSGYNGMFQSLPMATIPGGIAALNVLVLVALFGRAKPQAWAFHALVVIDVAAIAILALVWASLGFQDSGVNVFGAVLIGLIGIKAVLTYLAAKKL